MNLGGDSMVPDGWPLLHLGDETLVCIKVIKIIPRLDDEATTAGPASVFDFY